VKKIILASIIACSGSIVGAQNNFIDSNVNSAQKILNTVSNRRVTLGGYAQIDYNQAYIDNQRSNGKLDVHRMVLLTGYKFSDDVSFITEVEFEHVKEVYIEQAFINWKLNDYINFRGGLMLIPMGIVNEYHEPVTYNGVERPNVDKYIVPTTWREIGAGFTGNINEIGLKYQVYVVNGFNGYDGSAKLSGNSGLRSGRQKGAESTMSSPNLSFKLDYYGVSNLKVGLSGYLGKTQSSMYSGVALNDNQALSSADSTVVGVNMFGADARYKNKGFEARTQYILGNISNASQYNTKLGTNLGSALQGYYVELGYDLLRLINKNSTKRLVLFSRYENYNTHHKVGVEIIKNDAYNRTEITSGLTYHIAQGVALKADWQLLQTKANKETKKQLNLGIGMWF
jgi:hypothetical protein